MATGRHPAPVPGTAAVRQKPAVRTPYVRFPAIPAASPSGADMAAGGLEGSTWPEGDVDTLG